MTRILLGDSSIYISRGKNQKARVVVICEGAL